MSARWLPEKGALFYADCQITFYKRTGGGGGGGLLDVITDTATYEKVKDRSYNDTIFRMRGSDDNMVIADRVAGGYSYTDKPKMLQRCDYIFKPVGPEVAKALGIDLHLTSDVDESGAQS